LKQRRGQKTVLKKKSGRRQVPLAGLATGQPIEQTFKEKVTYV
jgi:hypothetical protein